MIAIGYMPLRTDYSSAVIRQPTKTTTTTTTRTSNLPPPRPVYIPPTTTQPPTQIAYHPVIVTTTASDPTTGAPATGDQFTAGTAPPTTTATGATTGTQTGSTGTSDTSRLIDLIAGSFKPQDIGQTYGPQSVSNSASPDGSGGGTNPMAVVILAILVMAGVFLYAHRKHGRAA